MKTRPAIAAMITSLTAATLVLTGCSSTPDEQPTPTTTTSTTSATSSLEAKFTEMFNTQPPKYDLSESTPYDWRALVNTVENAPTPESLTTLFSDLDIDTVDKDAPGPREIPTVKRSQIAQMTLSEDPSALQEANALMVLYLADNHASSDNVQLFGKYLTDNNLTGF